MIFNNIDNNTGTMKQPLFTRRFLILAVAVFAATAFTGLLVPVIENACKYAQVSREMVDSGDWINLSVAHEPYDQKPPLLFWLGAVFYSLFGVSFVSFKLPVLLLSFLGIYSTYRFALLLYNRIVGLLAAFFWSTSLGYFYFHNDIHTDTVLANFVMLAIWQLAAYFRYKKWHQFVIGVAAIGLAMLAKGPVGLAIPAAAIGVHLLAHRKYKEIFHWRWLLAIPMVLVIISPALIGLFKQFGAEGIKFFFWTNNVGRVTGSYRASNSDFTYYFHNLILMTSPWFVFVYTGLILEFRKIFHILFRKEKLPETGEFINIAGFTLFFIVLTIASQKNPHYLMAILPLVMILAAKWALAIYEGDVFPKAKKIITALNRSFPVLIWPLVLAFLFWFYPEKRIWFWVLFIAGTAGFIYSYFEPGGLKKSLAILLIAQFIFFLSLNTSILPAMFKNYSTFGACRVFNEQAGPGNLLHSYRLRHWSIFYYSKSYGTWVRDDESLKKVLAQKGAWIFTDEGGMLVLHNWGVSYTLKGEFNHRNISGQTVGFLNPKTRTGKYEKHYLVELIN